MNSLTSQLDTVLALAEKATPGPWGPTPSTMKASAAMPAYPDMHALAGIYQAAHDKSAAEKIPKIYAAGQREQVNVIVGLRAVLAALEQQQE